MIELNGLVVYAYVQLNKFFQKNKINYYPSSIGAAYKEIFKRDSFACLSFYDYNNEQYYLYFNAAYSSDLNRMVFTSLGIVSRENLNIKRASYELKYHINSSKDVDDFINILKKELE